jgi:bifunctional non-homologous end joining protein LigD
MIDGELVALDTNGVSHFQLLQNALRNKAKLQYCAFDLMFHDGEDLRGLPLLERKKRLPAVLPRHRMIAFSRHRRTFGAKLFEEAGRRGLEGIMAKRADRRYVSGGRTTDWLKIKTSKRQEVVIAGFTARGGRGLFSERWSLRCARNGWQYIGHVGTGFSHKAVEDLHGMLVS